VRVEKTVIRLLIADDHSLFRQGIQALFANESDVCVVGEAANASEAISQARLLAPDVVLLDVAMPGLSSFEASRLILEEAPRTRILFLAVYDDEEHFKAAMAAGASGFVLKDSHPSQILAAVREIFGGASQLTPKGISRLVDDLQALARANQRWTRTALLTPRENEILRLITLGGTARQIAADLNLSIKTVEAHKFNLMRKLDVHNRLELLDFVVDNKMMQPSVSSS
jgi:two-component system, NarL family, response regulator NreC